jgi:hypothetical protein
MRFEEVLAEKIPKVIQMSARWHQMEESLGGS